MPRRLTWAALACAAAVAFWGLRVIASRRVVEGVRAPSAVTEPPRAGPATGARATASGTTASRTSPSGEGLGHIAGHLVGARPGDGVVVTVVARANDDEVRARFSDETTFEAHLPPGGYFLRAVSDSRRVALVDPVEVVAGRTAEVTVVLVDGASLAGRVRSPRGEPCGGLTIRAVCGGAIDQEAETEGDGSFEVAGLVAGRPCKLGVARVDRVARLVEDEGAAPVSPTWRVVTDVLVPAQGIDLLLPERATLHGAIGLGALAQCDFEEVMVTGPDATGSAGVDEDCAFEVVDLPPGPVTVSAHGPGYHLRATVVVPASGDPPPLCLRGPCLPRAGATLTVTLDPSLVADPAGPIRVWTNRSMHECPCAGAECVCADLKAGTHAVAHAGAEAVEVDLRAGDNRVTLRNERPLLFIGIVRDADGRPVSDAEVRCAGAGEESPRGHGPMFHLRCPSTSSGVGWRRDDGAWHDVAAAGTRGTPTVVDIVTDD